MIATAATRRQAVKRVAAAGLASLGLATTADIAALADKKKGGNNKKKGGGKGGKGGKAHGEKKRGKKKGHNKCSKCSGSATQSCCKSGRNKVCKNVMDTTRCGSCDVSCNPGQICRCPNGTKFSCQCRSSSG